MVPLDSHEVPRASQYSGTGCVLFGFEYGAITRCGGAFQLTSSAYSRITYAGPTTPNGRNHPVWALPISLAATPGIDLSFSSSGYLDVSVPRVPFIHLWIQCMMTEVCSAGFPHSDIAGSKDICSSPALIAAYHVFHRLSVPRHPPCALLRLTFVCPFPKKWLPPVPPSVENIRRMS